MCFVDDLYQSDKLDLILFLKTITKSTKDSVEQWKGTRNMVDLKQKDAQPIEQINLISTNFNDKLIWLNIQNKEVINPYKLLPPLFDGWSELELEDTMS